jgi:hypothetical protein
MTTTRKSIATRAREIASVIGASGVLVTIVRDRALVNVCEQY